MTSKPAGRRRADAERSRAAILDAAVRLLAGQPDAGMGAIAAEAGVTRQTVYAHFASRDDLLAAVADRVTEEATAAMDAAELDEGPASAALLRLLDIGWRSFAQHPVLLQAGRASPMGERERARHEPVTDRLVRLIRRGQAAGEFDPGASPAWLAAATIALGHAAGDEVGAGRMSLDEASAAVRTAVLRTLGARAAAPGDGPDER
ncbi:TetR/AcrR family transcriptional regulator [Streptomyces sp. CB03238]|uniref:TetR/AcrR family transcriptional regulator n=1 Tax=Streptomyces sp. CB03238 TaxID=1907777 RepID=UPI000A0F91DC|nr:TetR/AcrR family transcriptional regulator [Streptomyces sp. CB03238]ORT59404.1 TetR family transcriptional regulator [Streptomyces sp. CB03238]